jgi:hypothetical protein
VNLGCALEELAFHAEGEACHRRALELQADSPEALHNLGSGQLMRQLYRPDLNQEDLIVCHRRWGDAQLAAAPALRPPPPRAGAPRIGFLSSDFRRHAVTSFLEPLLEHLDRGRFELVCFASQTMNDACTERLQRLPLEWQPCHTLDDGALAALIRAEGIDVLIDLNGHTRGTRLGALACKPAPVQASWLGYPFLTGLPTIDYRITDAWVLDGDSREPKAPEQPLLMDRCQYVYRPLAEAPPVSVLPALETEGVTFGSRSNLNKLTPAVVALWSQLLHRCPGSRLLLQYSHLADPIWRGWVRGAFAAHGHAHIGLLQGGGVVHAVAGHGDHMAVGLEGGDETEFVFGRGSGKDIDLAGAGGQVGVGDLFEFVSAERLLAVADTEDLADGAGCDGVIAGDHLDANAGALALGDSSDGLAARGINDAGDAE